MTTEEDRILARAIGDVNVGLGAIADLIRDAVATHAEAVRGRWWQWPQWARGRATLADCQAEIGEQLRRIASVLGALAENLERPEH